MKPIIYYDMDGVLFDLDQVMQDLYGFKDHDEHSGTPAYRAKYMSSLSDMVTRFGFQNLPKMARADELEQFYVKNKEHANFAILTSHGSFHNDCGLVAHQKMMAIDRNFHNTLAKIPFMVVCYGQQKAMYSFPGSYLVDDTKKNIDAYNANGGLGFLYTVGAHKDIMYALQNVVDNNRRGLP